MARYLLLAVVAALLALILFTHPNDSGLPVEAATANAPAPAPVGEESSTTVLVAPTTTLPAPAPTTVTTELSIERPKPLAVTSAPANELGVWDRLAACESGGRWDIHDSLHSGGLQFAYSTWRAAGGERFAPFAHEASREQQIEIAREWLARTSPTQWPVCSKRVGLTMANGAVG